MILLNRYWGFAAARVSKYKFEFLPRFTLNAMTDMLEFSIGFLWFQLWLTVYSRRMREFNRKNHDAE